MWGKRLYKFPTALHSKAFDETRTSLFFTTKMPILWYYEAKQMAFN